VHFIEVEQKVMIELLRGKASYTMNVQVLSLTIYILSWGNG
jgi:hypothetical protein